ncbi:hypothetical protein P4S72_17970 [Vibrio sp. PP-XX7]
MYLWHGRAGGYQFVGRTLQMWNRYRKTEVFDKPWLLRFFDQIRFYEVSAEELLDIRAQHPLGQYPIRIEETTFSLADYQALLGEHADEIAHCQARQQHAFEAERQRWAASGQANFVAETCDDISGAKTPLTEGQVAVESHVAGNVWQVLVKPGQVVKETDVVMILEAMKMELEVMAGVAGVVETLCHDTGEQVRAGQTLLILNTYADEEAPIELNTTASLQGGEYDVIN